MPVTVGRGRTGQRDERVIGAEGAMEETTGLTVGVRFYSSWTFRKVGLTSRPESDALATPFLKVPLAQLEPGLLFVGVAQLHDTAK